ncbi:hypothetical protein ACFY1L_52370, partial [Streptomyces sp. NPDC001663]|uniref:hypothetical protein n=1 Tax=Streptomyces sp. NPDC001663 TaxID=3364597 RepID=UPI0036C6C17E
MTSPPPGRRGILTARAVRVSASSPTARPEYSVEVLEVLTKASDVSVGDEAGGEAEEGFVDVVPSFP